jgi:hypothetical protein
VKLLKGKWEKGRIIFIARRSLYGNPNELKGICLFISGMKK